MKEVTMKVAEAAGRAAGYLQSHDLYDVLAAVKEAALNDPMRALVSSAAFGFLIGVVLRRS